MKEFNFGLRQKGVATAEWVTYVIIVIVVSAILVGKYVNYKLDNALEDALALGESQKGTIEAYFKTNGKMPQFGADAGLDGFTPSGVLTELTWQPGAIGEADSDPMLTGTLNGRVDLSEFGKRFEEFKSAYLLIARAQDDGTIIWDCLPAGEAKEDLPRRYLPEACERVSKKDDEESDES